MPRESPTSRTIFLCKSRGWDVEVTEHHVIGGITRDLFGFCDVAAITDNHLILIQCTDYSHASTRRRKILEQCAVKAKRLLGVPGVLIQVWAWKPPYTSELPKAYAVLLSDGGELYTERIEP